MTKKPFRDISDALNKADREKFLFNCFSIPDDQVRLTLVNCILQVPLSELEIEEINYLMKAISESKNIGAGQTEEIISIIFLIFTNLVNDQKQLVSKNFRIKYCKEAIMHCLEILLRNQRRKLEDKEEAAEKLMLSISSLFFLKASSASSEMTKKIEESDLSDYFYQNILAEENCRFEEHEFIPIEIETTFLGSSFANFKDLFFGADSLDPWNFTSFRVLQQVANILQNLDPLSINTFENISVEKITDAMTRNLKNGLRKRLNLELELWYDTREEEFQDYLKISKPFHERVEKEHNSFISKSGIYLLISFLTKKNVKGGLIKTTLENHSIFTNDDGEELALFKSTIFPEYEAVREKFNTEFEEMVKYESKTMSKRQMDEYKKKYSDNSDGEKYINMRKVLMRTPLITLQNK